MWKCLECGKRFKTERQAERAFLYGCPRCGGVDVDIDVDAVREATRKALQATQKRGGNDERYLCVVDQD